MIWNLIHLKFIVCLFIYCWFENISTEWSLILVWNDNRRQLIYRPFYRFNAPNKMPNSSKMEVNINRWWQRTQNKINDVWLVCACFDFSVLILDANSLLIYWFIYVAYSISRKGFSYKFICNINVCIKLKFVDENQKFSYHILIKFKLPKHSIINIHYTFILISNTIKWMTILFKPGLWQKW